jgi:hypothetical protein
MRSRKHAGRLTLILAVAVQSAVPVYALTTENLDIIWTIPVDTAFGSYLSSLASGDLDGDSIPDIAVASERYCDDSFPNSYRARVGIYYGTHVGDSAPDLVLWGQEWQGSSSPRLACGDLNGDGRADLVMADEWADGGYGTCTVWMGGNPVDTLPACIIRSRNVWWLNGGFGHDISIGDVNGDGYDDLVVGAYYAAERPGNDQTGRVYMFSGGHGEFDTIPSVILRGGHDGQQEEFGVTVSAEGDFDHDGFHDIFVGAWTYGGFGGKGRVYVYYGGDPVDTTYDMAMSGERDAQCLGVDKPGALNTQGSFDYAVLGHELWPHGIFNPSANCGKVYVWQGGRPMDSVPDVELVGRMDTASLGFSAQSAGDATGDGNDDLVAGAPWLPPGGTGGAYLWETGSHFDTVPDAWMEGEPNLLVGRKVCTAGDIDGDGRSEFLVASTGDPPSYVWVCKYTGSGVEEAPSAERRAPNCGPTVVRGVLRIVGSRQNTGYRADLLDATGRRVAELHYGPNNVAPLAPGVYLIREAPAQTHALAVRKVVVAR